MSGLDGAQIDGLDRSARRTEILAAKKRASIVTDVADVVADVATNTADIATNTADIATNTAQLNDLPTRFAMGTFTATTDATGAVTVTHGLGYTPTAVVVTPNSSNTSQLYAFSFTSTTFRVRFFTAAGAAVASASVTGAWAATG